MDKVDLDKVLAVEIELDLASVIVDVGEGLGVMELGEVLEVELCRVLEVVDLDEIVPRVEELDETVLTVGELKETALVAEGRDVVAAGSVEESVMYMFDELKAPS